MEKKIQRIQQTAEQAVKILGWTIYEQSVWNEADGYVFSFLLGSSVLLIDLPKESMHFGFALTKDEINNHYEELNVDWFLYKFKLEMGKISVTKPEEELEKEVFND